MGREIAIANLPFCTNPEVGQDVYLGDGKSVRVLGEDTAYREVIGWVCSDDVYIVNE